MQAGLRGLFMFRTLFQLLVLGVLGVFAYEFLKGDNSQSWSYCGDELRKEKKKMERLVEQAKEEIGSGAEVTWKEDASCISASVKNNRRLTSFFLNKVRSVF
jgi:hypothetical protein